MRRSLAALATRGPTQTGWLLALLVLLGSAVIAGDAGASRFSRVFVNGLPVPVFFNDGDSFRIFGGDLSGSQCRLGGYNTLESYGPAHQFGRWHPYELYINAKMATYNARRGTWHCSGDGSRDTYGRLLLDCPDLAVDQIRRGYAHAMEIDDSTSRPEYLRAQREAIRAGRGMWANGYADYIMTSVHSADEDTQREWHYNRLVSVRDGHSESMQHNETYSECEWVCNQELRVDLPAIRAAAQRLRASPRLAPLLGDFSNLHLIEFASRFNRLGELPEYLQDERTRSLVQAQLAREREAGQLGPTHTVQGACVLYVEFRRRYGLQRASCLRGHGTVPPGAQGVPHVEH